MSSVHATNAGSDPQAAGDVTADGRYQAETLAYAVGDDLVVCGVVYSSDQWQCDGEGGVEPRQSRDEYEAALDLVADVRQRLAEQADDADGW